MKKEINIHVKSTEDATHSFSDNSRRQLQSSDSTTQSVYSTDDVQVDDSDQLDAAGHHKLSNTGDNDTGVFDAVVDCSQQQVICEVSDEKFRQICTLRQHMSIHEGETTAGYDDCGMIITQKQSLETHVGSEC